MAIDNKQKKADLRSAIKEAGASIKELKAVASEKRKASITANKELNAAVKAVDKASKAKAVLAGRLAKL